MDWGTPPSACTVQIEQLETPPTGTEQVWPRVSQNLPGLLPTGRQKVSSQSARPSQSLSKPSAQRVSPASVFWAVPPFPVQRQAVPAQVRPLGPHSLVAQSVSWQSALPSQSLSAPSSQL